MEWIRSKWPSMAAHRVLRASTLTFLIFAVSILYFVAMFISRQATALLSAVPLPAAVSAKVDIGWYPPARTDINDLDKVLKGKDIYGFIYDSSETPDDQYGSYNWCNMPHVRRKEYVRPPDEYELHYVELVCALPRPPGQKGGGPVFNT